MHTLNTVRYTKTAFFSPKKYDEHPCHFYLSPLPPPVFSMAWYKIEDITWWREDMNFMLEWQEQYLRSECMKVYIGQYIILNHNIYKPPHFLKDFFNKLLLTNCILLIYKETQYYVRL